MAGLDIGCLFRHWNGPRYRVLCYHTELSSWSAKNGGFPYYILQTATQAEAEAEAPLRDYSCTKVPKSGTLEQTPPNYDQTIGRYKEDRDFASLKRAGGRPGLVVGDAGSGTDLITQPRI